MAQSRLERAGKRLLGIGPGRPSEHELVRYVETRDDGTGIREKTWSVAAIRYNAHSALQKLIEIA